MLDPNRKYNLEQALMQKEAFGAATALMAAGRGIGAMGRAASKVAPAAKALPGQFRFGKQLGKAGYSAGRMAQIGSPMAARAGALAGRTSKSVGAWRAAGKATEAANRLKMSKGIATNVTNPAGAALGRMSKDISGRATDAATKGRAARDAFVAGGKARGGAMLDSGRKGALAGKLMASNAANTTKGALTGSKAKRIYGEAARLGAGAGLGYGAAQLRPRP